MPESPPAPLPDRNPARAAFLRVLIASAVVPVLFIIAWNLPLDSQDPFIKAGIWLVGLIPGAAVLMGVVSFVRGDRQSGAGYLIGALAAGTVGVGSCIAGVLASL